MVWEKNLGSSDSDITKYRVDDQNIFPSYLLAGRLTKS